MSPGKKTGTYWDPRARDCWHSWNPEGMRGPSDWGDRVMPTEEALSHRLTFVMRILKRREWEKHGKKFTAFLRIFRYDPENGQSFFKIDKSDIIPCPKDDLFGRFSYQPEGDPHLSTCDYTDLYPYSCKPDETYDPPQGLELAAKLNVHAYQKALSGLQRLQLIATKKKARFARDRLLEYYDRIVDDFKEWVYRNYPEMPDCLQQVESSQTTRPKPASKKDAGFKDMLKYSPDETGKGYKLLPAQVEVIRLLYEEYKKKGLDGMLHERTITSHLREKALSSSDRVRDVFKSRIEAYNELIECIPKPKGYFA